MVLCGLAVSTVWPVARVPLLTLPPSVTVSFSVLHCCSGTGWRRCEMLSDKVVMVAVWFSTATRPTHLVWGLVSV